MTDQQTVAFIFCRGGSKGLPGKNTRLLAGKPLLAYSIDIARQCPSIDRIVVSTDDEKIAEIATDFGAEVPALRPPELARDDSNEWLAWRHAIDNFAGDELGTFVSLPATSPLRSVADVEQCIGALSDDVDIVVTVTPARSNPWFSMVVCDENGLAEKIMGNTLTRRQDAPPVFDCTGVAYVTTPQYIRQATGVYDGRVKPVVIPVERAVDIDDSFDFFIAQSLIQQRHSMEEAN